MTERPTRNPDPEVEMDGDEIVLTFYDDYWEANTFWGHCDVRMARDKAEQLIAQMQAALHPEGPPDDPS